MSTKIKKAKCCSGLFMESLQIFALVPASLIVKLDAVSAEELLRWISKVNADTWTVEKSICNVGIYKTSSMVNSPHYKQV